MSEISDRPPPPAPGVYRWDGQAWRAQPDHTVRTFLLGLGAVLAALLIGVCAGRAGSTAAPTASATAAPQSTTASTPAPAATPLALSGQGSKVVEFDLPKGSYKLAWQAQGHANFIVHLEGSESTGLVNEIPPNPSSGETFVRLGGGHYALNVQASTLNWSITLTPI